MGYGKKLLAQNLLVWKNRLYPLHTEGKNNNNNNKQTKQKKCDLLWIARGNRYRTTTSHDRRCMWFLDHSCWWKTQIVRKIPRYDTKNIIPTQLNFHECLNNFMKHATSNKQLSLGEHACRHISRKSGSHRLLTDLQISYRLWLRRVAYGPGLTNCISYKYWILESSKTTQVALQP